MWRHQRWGYRLFWRVAGDRRSAEGGPRRVGAGVGQCSCEGRGSGVNEAPSAAISSHVPGGKPDCSDVPRRVEGAEPLVAQRQCEYCTNSPLVKGVGRSS